LGDLKSLGECRGFYSNVAYHLPLSPAWWPPATQIQL